MSVPVAFEGLRHPPTPSETFAPWPEKSNRDVFVPLTRQRSRLHGGISPAKSASDSRRS